MAENFLKKVFNPCATLLICIALYFSGFFTILAESSLDLLFVIRGERPTSQEIVIIGVDEQTLDHLGSWPLSRLNYAELLSHVQTAKVVVFDFLFTEQTDADSVFNESMTGKPPVVLVMSNDYDDHPSLPASSLTNHFDTGSIETILGNNGIVRKVNTASDKTDLLYKVLLRAGGVFENDKPVVEDSYINFYGPEFSFLYISFHDVLEGHLSQDVFKDRYVFVGAQAVGLGDVHITPFSNFFPTPGVEVQATILNNNLDGTTIMVVSQLVVFTITFLFLFILFQMRLPEWINLVSFFLVFFLIIGLSYLLFEKNYFLEPLVPLFLTFIYLLVHMVTQGFWLTKEMIVRVRSIRKDIKENLHSLYTTMPSKKDAEQRNKSSSILPFKSLSLLLTDIEYGGKALTAQNQFIRYLLKHEAPPFAIWSVDDVELVIVNSTFSEFWLTYGGSTQVTPSLISFLDFVNRFTSTSDMKVNEDSLKLATAMFPKNVDIELSEHGIIKFFRISMHSVDAEETGFSGYLASFVDVTEIKQLERIKGDILSIVSHELKLPLTTILGYGEMLADTLPDEQAGYAKEICFHSQRLNNMIVEFLDLERMESGNYSIRKMPFEILELINDAVSVISQAAAKKDIQIQLDLPIKTTLLVGDEILLLQAFINVFDNSVKFSSPGGHVSLRLEERTKDIVTIITDQGKGIPQEHQQDIFEKFIRDESERNLHGFGLGLPFVKQVVESHSGTIEVQSKTDGPTSFMITLPKN